MINRARLTPYLFLVPVFILVIGFRYYPTLLAVVRSFFYWNGTGTAIFAGLENYVELFGDSTFLISLRNLVMFTVVRIVMIASLTFIVAEVVYSLASDARAYRWKVAFIVPMVVPWVVILLIWQFIYNPDIGILNQLLDIFGLDGLRRSWLGDPDSALISLALVQFPYVATIQFLIIVSGVQSMPIEQKESSMLDGAGVLRRILFIDLPTVRPQIILAVLLTLIYSFQRFAMFEVLTQGGPGSATQVPGYYLYQSAFNYTRFGYACAIGVVLMMILMSISSLNLKFMESDLGN